VYRSRARLAAFGVLLAGMAVLVVGGVASGNTASKALINIHESGTINTAKSDVQGAVHGKFTIELKLSPFGPGGTTAIVSVPSSTKYVNGEMQVPFAATDDLTSKTGTLELAITGTHIDVNTKDTPSGNRVGPFAEYGTWKIRSATGSTKGWKGGGNWASAAYGYGKIQPYSVEWDGYMTP
jgi:hypothetical protein